jgi:radical SAM superfamily enzyme YgiQ (UPF0313 family)
MSVSGSAAKSVLVWQMPGNFAGEDQHRLAHRRIGPMLASRMGPAAPQVVHATGPVAEVIDRCARHAASRPDVLVLPAFRDHAWRSLDAVRTLAQGAPELPVLLSGWGAEPDYVDAICRDAPLTHPRFFLARGEVEETLVDAIELLTRGPGETFDLERLGLAQPDGQGGWLSRGRFRSVENLSGLPSPYLHGAMEPGDAGGMVLIEVARGCLFRCHFCLSCNYPRQAVRPFPIERIRAEIEYAAARRAARVGLLCSGLNYDAEVIEAVADTLDAIAPDHRPKVDSTVHASLLDERRLGAIERIPWGRMIVGLQSINPEALALMHREVDPSAFRRAVERIAPFHTPVIELILALPGDSLPAFAATMRFVLSLPVEIEVYHLRLDPGSIFFQQRHELGLVADFAREGRVLSTPTFPAQDLARAQSILREIASRPWHYRATRLGFDFELLYSR